MTFSPYSLLATLPDAEIIRKKAAEVVARPEFQLDSGSERETFTLWIRLVRWLISPFVWLSKMLQGLPSPLWWLVVIVLSLVLLALIAHISWTLYSAIKNPGRRRSAAVTNVPTATAEDLERAAFEAEAVGDFIGMIRLLFRAGLRRIEKAEDKPIRRGITNYELLKRYRKSPLFEPLEWFVDTIDSKWYGHDVCVSEDCSAGRKEYSRIRELVERQEAHAVGA